MDVWRYGFEDDSRAVIEKSVDIHIYLVLGQPRMWVMPKLTVPFWNSWVNPAGPRIVFVAGG